MSHLEGMLNKLVLYIVLFQTIFCIGMAIGGWLWMRQNLFYI